MNAGRDVEQLIANWLVEEAPARAPDRVLGEARHQIDHTRQRRFAVDWREPMIISTGRLLAAAAVIVVAVVGAGWVGRTTAPGALAPSPTAAPTTSPSPAVTADSYRTARNGVCRAFAQQLNPLKPRFLGIWDGSISAAQRADWVEGLRQFADGYDRMTASLEAVAAPPELAAAHAATIGQLRAETSLIRSVASDLEAKKDTEAKGVDESTNPISESITSWEQSVGLALCP